MVLGSELVLERVPELELEPELVLELELGLGLGLGLVLHTQPRGVKCLASE